MDDRTTGRRAQRRSQHQTLSRQQLLDAAEEVFSRRGFYEATLKDVAELAEFSVGSVYSFFANKEDLYLNVFRRRGDEYLPAMRTAVAEGVDALAQLHRLIDFEVAFFRDHPAFGRLYLRSARAGALPAWESPVDQRLVDNFHEAMAIQAAVFVLGQREGTLRDGDPAALARLLSGLVGAFHAVDPTVTGELPDDPRPSEGPGPPRPLPLEALHDVVERAFARPR